MPATAPSDAPEGAFLAPATFVDSDHPAVLAYALEALGEPAEALDDRTKAVRLFYRVRDGIRYDPYNSSSDPADYKASAIVTQTGSWCVPKAIVLCALSRAVGVPCRLGFADVKNHLASEKLLARVGTDLFAFHGYVEFWLEGRWVKATPAFNIEMCTRFGVQPLEFDGAEDSLYHAFDVEGRRHMEYVQQRGTFVDFPWDEMQRVFLEVYGHGPGEMGETDGAKVHDEMFHDPTPDQPTPDQPTPDDRA